MAESIREQWETQGYLVIRGIYDPGRAERLLSICEQILDRWRVHNPENDTPGGGPDTVVMRHLNHPGYFKDHPWWRIEMLEAAADARVLDVARAIFDEEPLFRCTSFFFNPLEGGRDGNWHRDSQFSTPDEEKEKALIEERSKSTAGIQMQIALWPSDDVEYVPGSHLRWDTPEEYYIRRADDKSHNESNDMPNALRLALEPGDAALFNPMGLHRGRYHVDRKRRTFMLTYTPASKLFYDYFSHQPWFMQPGYLDGIQPATKRFFQRFIDAYEKDWIAAKKTQDIGIASS